jgi:hypothetical protein
MVRFAPTPGGNDLHLQRQIRRDAGAPLGPVTLRPGQGDISVQDATGTELFGLDPYGIRAFLHGQVRSLPETIESKATTTYVDGNVTTLRARDDEQQIDIDRRATRTYVDGNITTLVAKDNALQADINTRATRTYVDGNIATLVSRANGVDSRLDGHDSAIAARATRTYVDGNIATLVGRVDEADNRITKLRAQTRAWMSDAKYAFENGGSTFPSPIPQ